jgi:hypothetical protein
MTKPDEKKLPTAPKDDLAKRVDVLELRLAALMKQVNAKA